MINVKDIKNLYEIFQDSDIGEIEIHSDTQKLCINIGEGIPAPAPVSPAPVKTEAPKTETAPAKSGEAIPNAGKVHEMKSQWVGFFTRLNPKTKDYYVKLRDQVKKGQIIAHVRVLGVLQDVKADVDGKVKEILIEEGQPIEFGQPIIRLEI